jgi:alanine racemase
MSHLASADEESPQNDVQRTQFLAVSAAFPSARASLANSAGICLGTPFHLGLTRPGLSIYGGIARSEGQGNIQQVVTPEAEILQIRTVKSGDPVGYNATWRAPNDQRVAIVNLGYADGYSRAFSGLGKAKFQDANLPVIGRVSMDLIALALPQECAVREGDFVQFDFNLTEMSQRTGISPYELLTSMGQRYDRIWE